MARALAGDSAPAASIMQASGRVALSRAGVGRDPRAMPELVCEAVRKRRFHVLPHQEEFAGLLEGRLRRRLDMQGPAPRAGRR